MSLVQSPISAIVTAFKRVSQTLITLQRLFECDPPPAEILTHVDGNETECAEAIRRAFPAVKVVISTENLGPGGGRNKLIRAASQEVVASFDDDSYPLDKDYFARCVAAFQTFPDASVLSASIFHRNQTIEAPNPNARWVGDFVGCGCVYRRDAFLATQGYLPLVVAYQMEEVDVALQLHGLTKKILHAPWLRVFHNTDFSEHSEPRLVAGTLSNLALLIYLRYPMSLWPRGMLQVLNLLQYNLRQGRLQGVISGMVSIPRHAWTHRKHRRPLPRSVLQSFWALRRNPVPAGTVSCEALRAKTSV